MAAIPIQLVGKVHNADGFKRALLDTYAATTTKPFRDYGFATHNTDGFHPTSHHRTEAETVLIALLNLTAVGVENSNTCHSEFKSEVGW